MGDVDGIGQVKIEGEGIKLGGGVHVSTSEGFGGFVLKTIVGVWWFRPQNHRRAVCWFGPQNQAWTV
jgi:hypothetical protein